MDSELLEQLYVRSTYRRLASQPLLLLRSTGRRSLSSSLPPSSNGNREWPRVKEFISKRITPHGVVVDIGCGQGKYRAKKGFTIGVDSCEEALLQCRRGAHRNMDFILADAAHMPFRAGFADGVLCVSVLHHFATARRRLGLLRGLSQIMAPSNARALLYVWAMEQPNAQFKSCDVLVPVNLHEFGVDGLPPVSFHRDSTREQRIIRNSIPLGAIDDCGSTYGLISVEVHRQLINARRLWRDTARWIQSRMVDPTFRRLQVTESELRISHYARRLLQHLSVEEWLGGAEGPLARFATYEASRITEEAIEEALKVLSQEIYRYYHLFIEGELEGLIGMVGDLKLIQSGYDQSNWYAVVEKRAI